MQQRQASHTSSAAHVANATADQVTTTGQSVPQFVRSSQQQRTTTTTTTTGNYAPAAYGQTVTNAAGELVTTYQAPTAYTVSGDQIATSYPHATGDNVTTTYHPAGQTTTTYQLTGPATTTTAAGEQTTTTYQPTTTYTQETTTYQQPATGTYTTAAGEHSTTTSYQPATTHAQTATTYQQAATGSYTTAAGEQTTTTYQPTTTYTQATTTYQQPATGSYQTRYVASGAQIAGQSQRTIQSHTDGQYTTGHQQQVTDSRESHTVTGQQTSVSKQITGQIQTRETGTRVIGHETGAHRLVSVTERVDESRSTVLSQNVVSHEIRIPKRIVREEVMEKVIIVPEKKLVEEFVDEIQTVKETIIEVAKPTIVEKIIEVPEIEIVERIVEVPEKRIEERIVQVEKVIQQQRTVGEPEVVYIDKVVDVPVPEERYRDVEKIVEVPEWHDEIVTKEVRVPVYVDVPTARTKAVPVTVDVHRDLPVPVEAEVSYEYRMPQLKPRYARVAYPVFLPRFIEVPVAAEMLNPDLTAQAHKYLNQVSLLIREAASMCEIEGLAADILKTDFQKQVTSTDLQSAVLQAWKTERIGFKESDGLLRSAAVPQKVETIQVQTTQARSIPITATSTQQS